MSSHLDYSPDFYHHYADRYAQVSHQFIQSTYTKSSHPGLKDDLDLINRLKELVSPRSRGLDAGCGAGARDVFYYWRDGYDILGVDAIEENIQLARTLHPEIARRISIADLTLPLEFATESFDFVLCDAVIQHIAPDQVEKTTLPELSRVLKVGGVLQLMFKCGHGVKSVFDRDYEAERTFQLYDIDWVEDILAKLGMEIVPVEGDKLGGIMRFTDPKPMEHCVFYSRKVR